MWLGFQFAASELGSEHESDLQETVEGGMGQGLEGAVGRDLFILMLDKLNLFDLIFWITLGYGSALDEKSSFRCWDCFSLLN